MTMPGDGMQEGRRDPGRAAPHRAPPDATPVALDTLHARAEALRAAQTAARARADAQTVSTAFAGENADRADDGYAATWAAHAAVHDRLALMRRHAEAEGWHGCAVERDDRAGRFVLFGVPPGATLRTRVPEPLAPEREAAGGAVRRAARALATAHHVAAGQAGRGPSTPRETRESRERLPHPGERLAWRALDAAHATFLGAVTTYTRELRVEGRSVRQTVVAVAAHVRAGSASEGSGSRDAHPAATARAATTSLVAPPSAVLLRMLHDAGCRCVESYYAPSPRG